DSGEFYNAKQDNIFSEYKPFRAEEYYSFEFGRTPEEIKSYNESFNNEGVKSTKSRGDDSADANDIQKQYDKIKQSDSSEISDTSATSSGSNASQTANASQAAAKTVSSGAATATGGATVATTAVAAVVIVSAAVTGGFIADFNSYIGNNTGMDYVCITVDMDEILSQADKSYGLSADNFSIEFADVGSKIALVDGKHSYLVTGLQPEKTYTYNLICNNPSLGSNSKCYSQTLTTLSVGEPEGVYDELNNYITYDEATRTASVFYSVYLSDYENKYAYSTLYLCSSEQTDLSNINHIVYSDNKPDDNNFFKGEVDGVTYDELYLYVVGEGATEYGAEAAELFSIKLTIDFPEEWQTAKNPDFTVDESAEELTSQPDEIRVSGKLNKLNESYTYYAYVVQYSEDGTQLCERQEVGLITDPDNMTYSLMGKAYYGVNMFKYVVYTHDGDDNEVIVFESERKQFTASQDYGATYTKVEPTDATIEYGADGVTITVNPEFASDYNNYYYKLVVTNSEGKMYGEYSGTGVAVIEIADYTGLDEINFTYYDFGTFEDGEIEYGSHATEGVAFCVPEVSLDAEYGFDGQYFTLFYTCDMIYGYAEASLDIELRGSDGTAYSKRIESVSEKGTVILDNIEGEIGDVTVTATLNFKDYQSDGATHSIIATQAEYALNYSFEVTSVKADLSGFSTEMMLVTLSFDYLLPDGYKIEISDEANSLSLSTDLTGQYSFSDLAMDTEANLTIQVTDGNGNAWGEPKTISISPSAANEEYVSPTMSCPNPGDAVVTYNEDGTINVYRQMIPDAYGRDTVSDDERVYYDAHLYAGYYDADYNFIETHSYEVIGRGKYAVIENIAKENYNLTYYNMFDYNGVSYVMAGVMPSGTVETIYDCGVAAAIVADGQTTVNVSVSKYGKIANKIIVNGVEYEYDYYSDESQTNLTLTFDGEVDVSEVTIFFTSQGYNYDAYGASGEITMKGSKYGEYTITLTPVEA
ncbi:MAG: hypothetical protein ACI4MC_07225, partial [Candidatus Coproplasma sp.]